MVPKWFAALTALFALGLGLLIGFTGSAHAMTPASSTSCAIKMHARGGVNSVRGVLTADYCGLKVKTKTLCWTIAGPTYWEDGNIVAFKPFTHGPPKVSKAQCTLSYRTDPFGYLYKPNLTFPWEWIFLGPIPPHERGAQPSKRCNPRAFGTVGGLGLIYTAHFKRLPCGYDFQAAMQCNYLGGSYWEFGPTAAFVHGVAKSATDCNPEPPATPASPGGYRWRPNINSGWRFHALIPVPPVEK